MNKDSDCARARKRIGRGEGRCGAENLARTDKKWRLGKFALCSSINIGLSLEPHNEKEVLFSLLKGGGEG